MAGRLAQLKAAHTIGQIRPTTPNHNWRKDTLGQLKADLEHYLHLFFAIDVDSMHESAETANKLRHSLINHEIPRLQRTIRAIERSRARARNHR